MAESGLGHGRGVRVKLKPIEGSARFDLARFVNQVADLFEFETPRSRGPVSISPGAREELVRKMMPHLPQLRIDLSSGEMTTNKLRGILIDVLKQAGRMRRGRSRWGMYDVRRRSIDASYVRPRSIGVSQVRIVMKWKCRYLGWC